MPSDQGVLTLISSLTAFMHDESGATAVEYGLVGTFMGVMIISGLNSAGTRLRASFNDIANNLSS